MCKQVWLQRGREGLTACKKAGLWNGPERWLWSQLEKRQMHRFLPQFALHCEAVLRQIALTYWASTMSPLLTHYFWPSNILTIYYAHFTWKGRDAQGRENKCKATQLVSRMLHHLCLISKDLGQLPLTWIPVEGTRQNGKCWCWFVTSLMWDGLFLQGITSFLWRHSYLVDGLSGCISTL